MRFGGHETFAVREGWLHKGIDLLIREPQKLVDDYSADWLGVGRNMAKSIRHWLVACELATLEGTSRKPGALTPTSLAQLIHETDPYLLELGTWWALHANLVRSTQHALTWNWFFNNFRVSRFEKPVCLQGLKRHLESHKVRLPSPKTLDRDLSCLLSTYGRKLPPTSDDPEDALECPMVDLGLLTLYRDSGVYELHLGPKPIPPALLGYALSRAFRVELHGKKQFDIGLRDAVVHPNSLGAVFALNAESLFEMMSAAESQLDGCLSIVGLASQRAIRLRVLPDDLDWLHQQKQTPTAIERFWKVVLVSALSESLDRIDVAHARKVFVDAFLKSREGWQLQIPTVPLDELYGQRVTAATRLAWRTDSRSVACSGSPGRLPASCGSSPRRTRSGAPIGCAGLRAVFWIRAASSSAHAS